MKRDGRAAPFVARRPVSPAYAAMPAAAGEDMRQRSVVINLIRALRPHQWTKNLIVFFGLIFSQNLFDGLAARRAALAFVVFCALSGVVYLVNDLRDREADRLHPVKSRRPIASGALAPATAAIAAVVLGSAALAAAFLLSAAFGLVASLYVGLLTLYSVSLKHFVILDVLTIAIGFVLRALAGAVAIDVLFSNWLLLLTLLGALFLGLSKRRAELVTLAGAAHGHRRSLAEYSPYLLDQMISVVTASTLVAYAFYTISPETKQRFGTEHLLLTMPFPLYGIFRYLYLVHQREGGGDPSEMLLTDRPLLACVALWIAAVIAIVYGPWH
jgi:4-hydroxybenzoate polyprenyltransferase